MWCHTPSPTSAAVTLSPVLFEPLANPGASGSRICSAVESRLPSCPSNPPRATKLHHVRAWLSQIARPLQSHCEGRESWVRWGRDLEPMETAQRADRASHIALQTRHVPRNRSNSCIVWPSIECLRLGDEDLRGRALERTSTRERWCVPSNPPIRYMRPPRTVAAAASRGVQSGARGCHPCSGCATSSRSTVARGCRPSEPPMTYTYPPRATATCCRCKRAWIRDWANRQVTVCYRQERNYHRPCSAEQSIRVRRPRLAGVENEGKALECEDAAPRPTIFTSIVSHQPIGSCRQKGRGGTDPPMTRMCAPVVTAAEWQVVCRSGGRGAQRRGARPKRRAALRTSKTSQDERNFCPFHPPNTNTDPLAVVTAAPRRGSDMFGRAPHCPDEASSISTDRKTFTPSQPPTTSTFPGSPASKPVTSACRAACPPRNEKMCGSLTRICSCSGCCSPCHAPWERVRQFSFRGSPLP